MALFSVLKSIYNTGKTVLNRAIKGAKYALPYLKTALPIVSKIASTEQRGTNPRSSRYN